MKKPPVNKALLDKRVKKEIEELRIAGRLHQFTPEPRCKVCKNPEITRVVNKLLAAGESYANILDDISPLNDKLPERARISYSSLRTHALNHFNKDEAAAAVYRRILEKHAQEAEIDFIEGVQNAVTPLAYLETTMNRGYQALVDPESEVSVELGLEAAVKLHSLTDKSEDRDLQSIIEKTNKLIEVVRSVVPVEYWGKIVRRLEEEEVSHDAPAGEIVDAELEDDEPFEPPVDEDDEEF